MRCPSRAGCLRSRAGSCCLWCKQAELEALVVVLLCWCSVLMDLRGTRSSTEAKGQMRELHYTYQCL